MLRYLIEKIMNFIESIINTIKMAPYIMRSILFVITTRYFLTDEYLFQEIHIPLN